jgi:hypothetical protein
MSNQANQSSPLVGRWDLVSSEIEDSEPATMEFTIDGKLIYSIHQNDRTRIINLVYEVTGDTIVTDQPSKPRKETTKFYFESNDTLVLDYGGEKAYFRRAK